MVIIIMFCELIVYMLKYMPSPNEAIFRSIKQNQGWWSGANMRRMRI